METHYKAVETLCETEDIGAGDSKSGSRKIPRKYLLRQIFVCSGIWASFFCFGLCFGSPTVMIPQLRKEANSSDAISVKIESSLSSTLNYTGIISAVVLAMLARLIGRKLTFLIVCVNSLIAFIILYYSKTVTHILISQIIHGPLVGCLITISIMVLTEYVSSHNRSIFLSLKPSMIIWGSSIANAIGTYMHWKNIAILGFICSLYSLLTCLLWPESPYWLANKSRFEDCAASHRWLKGRSGESEVELQALIESRRNLQMPAQNGSFAFYKKHTKMFTSKLFCKSIILSMSVLSLFYFSGKHACAMYSIDIIKRISGNESTAYTGMLILDGVTIFASYAGCGLSKIFKRRTLLLVSSTINVIILFCLTCYLYVIHHEVIPQNTVISMSLLVCYVVSISVGPLIMSSTILGELTPIKYRSSSLLLLNVFSNFLMGTIVKITPFITNGCGVRVLFLFFFISESFFIVVNYKVLPETKDKTILEIQDSLLK